MAITDAEIKKIAKLSMLEIPPDRCEALKEEMSSIITMVDKLGELELEQALDPTAVDGLYNVLRADTVAPSADRDSLLANAPYSAQGCFFVPQIVE